MPRVRRRGPNFSTGKFASDRLSSHASAGEGRGEMPRSRPPSERYRAPSSQLASVSRNSIRACGPECGGEDNDAWEQRQGHARALETPVEGQSGPVV
jgi:hypothetical protein